MIRKSILLFLCLSLYAPSFAQETNIFILGNIKPLKNHPDNISVAYFDFLAQKNILIKSSSVDVKGKFSLTFKLEAGRTLQLYNSFIHLKPGDSLEISFDSNAFGLTPIVIQSTTPGNLLFLSFMRDTYERGMSDKLYGELRDKKINPKDFHPAIAKKKVNSET